MSPPTLRFISEFWHPNVYPDGKVCISILHAPGHDEMSGERPEERWLPTQSVTTVVLSVLSMLGDPNYSSPANVDASVEWRRKPDEFKKRVAKLIEKAKKDIPAGLKIPHPDTDPEERRRALAKQKALTEDTFDIDEADYADADADYADADFDGSDIGDDDADIEEEDDDEPRPKAAAPKAAAPKEEKKAEATSGGKGEVAKAADATKTATQAKPSAPAASVVPAAAPAAVTVAAPAVSAKSKEEKAEGRKEESSKERKEKKGKEKKEKKAKKEASPKGKSAKEDPLTHSSKKAKTAEQDGA